MIRIQQLKISVGHTKEQLMDAIKKSLKWKQPSIELEKKLLEYRIVKQSIDAREKNNLRYIYTVDVSLPQEEKIVRRSKNKNVSIVTEKNYHLPHGKEMEQPPVIVGTGPAGLFCGLLLARSGCHPILIERGEPVENRVRSIEQFWKTNVLQEDSNVQFGEGGAGTFSDGKLNTGVKDKFGRNRFVLETFVEYGAPPEILYQNKPHIGTDKLREVIRNMRQAIVDLGGQVRFETKLTDIFIEKGTVTGIEVNGQEHIRCNRVVLALGHSARDTFFMLYQKGIAMIQKSFAIGLRVEHPAAMIHSAQYGMSKEAGLLPTADYKLVHHSRSGRGVYSFCMCPGGFVVNASSEKGRLVVNGMSNYRRDEINSNSAIVVTIDPKDFQDTHPLAGIGFQRLWEEKAYEAGRGNIPVQLLEDLRNNRESRQLGDVVPNCKGNYILTDLHGCLPEEVLNDILEGMEAFGKKIKGFDRPDAIFSGVETRTSSPVRMPRDEKFQCNIQGIYPCGEGAGYAGGITSAAIDGIKVAEAIISE